MDEVPVEINEAIVDSEDLMLLNDYIDLLLDPTLPTEQFDLNNSQLPGRIFSPSDKCKKLSYYFLLHFSIGMGSYDHHAKYQGVFP